MTSHTLINPVETTCPRADSHWGTGFAFLLFDGPMRVLVFQCLFVGGGGVEPSPTFEGAVPGPPWDLEHWKKMSCSERLCSGGRRLLEENGGVLDSLSGGPEENVGMWYRQDNAQARGRAVFDEAGMLVQM